MNRIEYENPFMPVRPDKVARADKSRRESNKHRSDSERKKARGNEDQEEKDDVPPEVTEKNEDKTLGNRMDVEA
jgi:hypothetical protein